MPRSDYKEKRIEKFLGASICITCRFRSRGNYFCTLCLGLCGLCLEEEGSILLLHEKIITSVKFEMTASGKISPFLFSTTKLREWLLKKTFRPSVKSPCVRTPLVFSTLYPVHFINLCSSSQHHLSKALIRLHSLAQFWVFTFSRRFIYLKKKNVFLLQSVPLWEIIWPVCFVINKRILIIGYLPCLFKQGDN